MSIDFLSRWSILAGLALSSSVAFSAPVASMNLIASCDFVSPIPDQPIEGSLVIQKVSPSSQKLSAELKFGSTESRSYQDIRTQMISADQLQEIRMIGASLGIDHRLMARVTSAKLYSITPETEDGNGIWLAQLLDQGGGVLGAIVKHGWMFLGCR